jgi:hypothetical protein
MSRRYYMPVWAKRNALGLTGDIQTLAKSNESPWVYDTEEKAEAALADLRKGFDRETYIVIHFDVPTIPVSDEADGG